MRPDEDTKTKLGRTAIHAKSVLLSRQRSLPSTARPVSRPESPSVYSLRVRKNRGTRSAMLRQEGAWHCDEVRADPSLGLRAQTIELLYATPLK